MSEDETKYAIPYLAPGCFGSAILYRSDDMVCSACPFQEQCKPAHEFALAEMRHKLGIKPPKVEPVPQMPREDVVVANSQDPDRMTLPKKVQELLARLDKASLDVVGNMQNGKNPFLGKAGFGFMAIAAHLIMHMRTPVTSASISKGMEKKKNWSKGTADAHARMAIQALEHVGAIENIDGVLSVKSK